MTVWAWPAIVFGAVLFAAAAGTRRSGRALAFAGYALGAALLSGVSSSPVRFAAPLAVLVIGYWLTKPFYTSPSSRLEAWLLRYDDLWQIDRLAASAPPWLHGLVEVAYLGAYPFMVITAIPAFTASPDAFAWHWTMVLAAELSCYVTLPWLQARPPRDIRNSSRLIFPGSGTGTPNREKSTGKNYGLRRFNEAMLDRLSVRATTIPSGHVAGPIAASLSAWMIAPAWGPWLMAGALAITAATVIGRYHYAIDAALGLAAGGAPPAIRWFWT